MINIIRAATNVVRRAPVAALAIGVTLFVLVHSPRRCLAVDGGVLASDDPTLELTNLQKGFQDLAQRVAPSVVAISAAIAPVDADDAVRSDDLTAQKLDSILDRVTRTVGTGFVIDADGFVVTNEHVIADAQQIWITTDDHRVYPAIVVGSDPRSDLAVLKVPAQKLTPVSFASERGVKRGEWTIALGNPYGLAGFGEMAMSVGVVSAVDRNLSKLSARENRLYTNLIQTTAQINPGNSGGPLFDLQGRVIGINTAVVMPQKQVNGIGFALPISNEMLAKIADLKAGREVVYGYLGVAVENPTPRQRRDAGAAPDAGVLVNTVESESPAASAAIKPGDLIMSVDGRLLFDSDQFVRVVGSTRVDEPVALLVMRDRKTLTLNVALARRPQPSLAVTTQLQRLRWRGMLLGPVPSNWMPGSASVAGVMVLGVDPQSPLAKDGVSSGTVITAIDGKPIADLLAMQRLVNDTPADGGKITFGKSADDLASVSSP